MDDPKDKYDFCNLIKHLESLLEETNHDKSILETQCEDASSLLQPWKIKIPSTTKETIENVGFDNVYEKESVPEIDEATNLQINKVIEKAQTVRKQVVISIEKRKSTKTVTASVKTSVVKINKSEENSPKNGSGSENIPMSRPSPSTSTAFNKNKSPYSVKSKTSHFYTTYQKHFSSVNKIPIKMSPKIYAAEKSPAVTKDGKSDLMGKITKSPAKLSSKPDISSCVTKDVKSDLMRDKRSPQPLGSGQRKLLTKVDDKKTGENMDSKTWYTPVESVEKCLEEAIQSKGVPHEMSYILNQYHQYLKGTESKKEVTFKSKFIQQLNNMNKENSNTSENKLLLEEQLKKYSDLYKDIFNQDKSSIQDLDPSMFTSYGRVEKVKQIQQRLHKLETLKMQLELFETMLQDSKNAVVNEEEKVLIYKTLTALGDISNLSVPLVVKKQ